MESILSLKRVVNLNQENKEKMHDDRLRDIGFHATSIVHELRNYLTPLKATIGMLDEEYSKNVEDKDIFNLLNRNIEKINHMFESVLKYSSRKEITKQPVLLHDLICQWTSSLVHYSLQNNVNISESYQASRDLVLIDSESIKQVFLNFIRNSVDACKECDSTEIHIETKNITKNQRRYIAVSFSDEGCGISPELLKKISQPFYTSKKSGTGLGLSISCDILNLHNAILEVTSEIGNGSKFTVFFELD